MGDLTGRGVGVDIVGLTVKIGGQRSDDGDHVEVESIQNGLHIHGDDFPHIADIQRGSGFRIGQHRRTH